MVWPPTPSAGQGCQLSFQFLTLGLSLTSLLPQPLSLLRLLFELKLQPGWWQAWLMAGVPHVVTQLRVWLVRLLVLELELVLLETSQLWLCLELFWWQTCS